MEVRVDLVNVVPGPTPGSIGHDSEGGAGVVQSLSKMAKGDQRVVRVEKLCDREGTAEGENQCSDGNGAVRPEEQLVAEDEEE